eukprot:CAMPEP_0202897284 /NCGR_PEP_ID=MMETSP1392-20130828/6088_1 /ASSEMBLY_ACC=CAM_ASM_000868 /TAXON_ID=225041 /ORGANISM="Chlamydomonas chlamydogama, Strain SAG 11-48b" /LENGTH=98 /DNA_ID=CAMNT_0049582883 /DNA_START=843 /DNA_END=1139 /DNA_ORIENTATION=-
MKGAESACTAESAPSASSTQRWYTEEDRWVAAVSPEDRLLDVPRPSVLQLSSVLLQYVLLPSIEAIMVPPASSVLPAAGSTKYVCIRPLPFTMTAPRL